MTQQPGSPRKVRQLLMAVRKDMDVVDANGNNIGKVDDMYFGSPSAADQGSRESSLIADLAHALVGGNSIPEVLRQRLLHDGYIRVNGSGLFSGHMYLLPEQIDVVATNTVAVNVTREELISA